jgi:hypothetical protein
MYDPRNNTLNETYMFTFLFNPIADLNRPEGSRKFRLPDFKTIGT